MPSTHLHLVPRIRMYSTCLFCMVKDSKGKAMEAVVVHKFCGFILVGLFNNDILPLLIAGIIFIYYIPFSFILSTTSY